MSIAHHFSCAINSIKYYRSCLTIYSLEIPAIYILSDYSGPSSKLLLDLLSGWLSKFEDKICFGHVAVKIIDKEP